MSTTVTVPLWLVVLIGAFAVWAVLEHMALPAVRWVMRRRFNRAIDDLNTRLRLRIQPFKLAKRQAMIDALIFDPEVLQAIEACAAEHGVTREAAQARAHRYARRSCPRSRPMRISASARGSRAASPRSSTACVSATWTRRL